MSEVQRELPSALAVHAYKSLSLFLQCRHCKYVFTYTMRHTDYKRPTLRSTYILCPSCRSRVYKRQVMWAYVCPKCYKNFENLPYHRKARLFNEHKYWCRSSNSTSSSRANTPSFYFVGATNNIMP